MIGGGKNRDVKREKKREKSGKHDTGKYSAKYIRLKEAQFENINKKSQINKSKKDPKTKGGGNINSRYSIIVDPVNKELIDINSNRGIEILKNYLYVLS